MTENVESKSLYIEASPTLGSILFPKQQDLYPISKLEIAPDGKLIPTIKEFGNERQGEPVQLSEATLKQLSVYLKGIGVPIMELPDKENIGGKYKELTITLGPPILDKEKTLHWVGPELPYFGLDRFEAMLKTICYLSKGIGSPDSPYNSTNFI